jgi:DNA processing protein
LNPRVARLRLAGVALACKRFPTQALFEAFGSPEAILQASPEKLRQVPALDAGTRFELLSLRDNTAPEKNASLEDGGWRLLSFEEAEYPGRLREIPDPPPVLFLRGRILPEDDRAVAVIGSRRASAYGLSVCGRLVRALVDHGFSIVSGMAKGVDAAAHWAALERGGRTVAVLGTGVDVVYPKANRQTFERILHRGALVSEFLPGTPAWAKNFPRRNRIISGMALGVLVVEAAERSGTMITVRTALEQGREVFAVPGDIRSPVSRGTHRLIKEGAKLVERVEDILEEFPLQRVSELALNRKPSCVDADGPGAGEQTVREREQGDKETLIRHLSDEGTHVEVLMERTGWPSAKMATLLTELELLGRVRRLPGGRYLRTDGETGP